MDEKFGFAVATDLAYYGDGATEADIEEYTEFAERYLAGLGYNVKTYEVQCYPYGEDAETHELRERVWEAFCKSH